jgi:transglutaminase-like putative cysteine protease
MPRNDCLAIGFLGLACRLVVSTCMGAEPGATNPKPFALYDTKHYRVTQEVVLTPSNDNRLSRVRVLLPVPVDLPQQSLSGKPRVEVLPLTREPLAIDVAGPHFKVRASSPFQMPVLDVDLNRPEPRQEWKVRLTSEVDVSNVKFDLYQVREVPYARLVSPGAASLYLRPESKVESDHPEILAALAEIFPEGIGQEAPAYDVVRKIYDWILDRSEYERNAARGRASKLWGALDMLRTQRGECGDYSALFVALCRAAKVPARTQVGFWAVNERSMHVWAEFYLPGIGWLPVDPSMGDHGPRARERAFANVPNLNQRVALTAGCDHDLPDQKIDLIQTFQYWFWYSASRVDLRAEFRFATE